MALIGDVLGLLNALIHSTIDEMVKITMDNIFDIKICLQNGRDNIEFSHLESQLQQLELQQWSCHCEPISIQNNETNSHKQQVNNLDSVPNPTTDLHAKAKIQRALPKLVIRPWEDFKCF